LKIKYWLVTSECCILLNTKEYIIFEPENRMTMENKFCVYLTMYKGNKLPPFYVGSSSIKKINAGYRGSVASVKYSKMWRKELKDNPHLFTTKIISKCATRQIAFDRENLIQHKFNTVKSSMYINEAYAKDMSYMTGPGSLNGMYGKRHSPETILAISNKKKGIRRTHEQKLAAKEKRSNRDKTKYVRRDQEFISSSHGTTLYTDPITTHSIRLNDGDFIPYGYKKGQLTEKTNTHIENMKDNLFYHDPITKCTKRFKDLNDVPANWVKGNINLKADKSPLFGVTYIKNFETGECIKTTSNTVMPKYHGHIHNKYAYIYENKVTFSSNTFVKYYTQFNEHLLKIIYKNNKISKKTKTIYPFFSSYDYYDEAGIKIIPINSFMENADTNTFEWLD